MPRTRTKSAPSVDAMPWKFASASIGALVAFGSVFAIATPAFATPTGFTPGDLVIYEVQVQSPASSAGPVTLADFGTNGTPSGYSLALPTSDSVSTHALVESGAALNDGELSLSTDGQSIVATGYDAAVGTASITGAAVPRTIAIVPVAGGTTDTTTALSDSSTETNNLRSATTTSAGSPIYIGTGGGSGSSGTGIANDGGSTATYLTTGDSTHQIVIAPNQLGNEQLFESTTKNIFQVGNGLPTSGTQTATALIPAASLPTKFDPDGFAFTTLGSGTTPDTMYVADGANGATTGDPSAVEKYSLVSGAWVASGSVSVPLPTGIAISVSSGTVSIYVTGATSTSASPNTQLYKITDSSGAGGKLTGSATAIGSAPSGYAFKGLVLLPSSPPAATPETPYLVALPALGLLLFGGASFVVIRRRNLVA